MKVVVRDLYLCIDCTFAAVNDDYTTITDNCESEREADLRIAEIERGLVALGPNLVLDSDEGETAGCGNCGWHGGIGELVDVYTDPDWTEKGCPNCKATDEIDTRSGGVLEFSRMECDCCGLALGGSRHRFAILGEGEESDQLSLF